jgi:hypothetical protein
MPEEPKPKPAPDKSVHGHIGPATAAEKAAKEADPAIVSQSEKAAIAEAASREEDA